MFLGEIAVIVFEAFVVHRNKLAENLAFNLLHEIINGVSVNKMTFFGIMGMKVKIKGKPILLV